MNLNPKEYIESGILEAYILGLASESEQREVSLYAKRYPEVSTAIADLEQVITTQFMGSMPPPNVRQKIKEHEFGQIKKWDLNEQDYTDSKSSREEVRYLDVEVSDTTIRVHKYWRPAFIAVFVLSKIFLAVALYYYFKSDSLDKENLKLQQEIQQLKSK